MSNIKVVRQEDADLLKLLKQDKVLMPIDPAYFGAKTGAVFIFCCDCDHSDDTWNHIQQMMKAADKPNRIFPVPRAGGAIWVPKSDLLKKAGLPRDEDIFFDIDIAFEHKGLSTIFTSVHAPCGAAGVYELSLFDQIELLVKSKKTLKDRYHFINDLEVKAFIPICYQGLRRRTYFVSAQNWNENCEKYREFDYTPGRLFGNAASA